MKINLFFLLLTSLTVHLVFAQESFYPLKVGANAQWFKKVFKGGKQCESVNPPSVTRELDQLGIQVKECRIQAMARCSACNVCPAYHYTAYIAVTSSNKALKRKIRKAGYRFQRVDREQVVLFRMCD